jgi:hypothetical protein
VTTSTEDARTIEAILNDPETDPETFREMSRRLEKLRALGV